jgi:hypothetical protein
MQLHKNFENGRGLPNENNKLFLSSLVIFTGIPHLPNQTKPANFPFICKHTNPLNININQWEKHKENMKKIMK